ncbi:DICT sensory domain-containing protein [Halorientalis sp.]|uniref:DICT sensory domain-containing protein n=1 Tax=Halorientalis sp. TaxID=1931229 RepID=UPI00260A90B9|nr:DICT sensory domain-containing protein [Halorientalis sp.]
MDLRGCIEFVRQFRKELVLFNVRGDDAMEESLAAHFDSQNVVVTARRTASGAPENVAVLSDRDGVLATVDLETLRGLCDLAATGPHTLGVADVEYEAVLGHLKETTFSSYDAEQMVYASREIEDRARRVGHGEVHAGFQFISTIDDQVPIYTDLSRLGIDTHVYGVPDTTPPDIGPGHVHPVDAEEIAETWFVVFDGNGDDGQKSALIAGEQAAGEFYGVWTYDPKLVDEVLGHLEATYTATGGGPGSSDGG